MPIDIEYVNEDAKQRTPEEEVIDPGIHEAREALVVTDATENLHVCEPDERRHPQERRMAETGNSIDGRADHSVLLGEPNLFAGMLL